MTLSMRSLELITFSRFTFDANRRSIYVGSVDYSVTEDELKEFFAACGTVLRVTIAKNHVTNHPMVGAPVTQGKGCSMLKRTHMLDLCSRSPRLDCVPLTPSLLLCISVFVLSSLPPRARFPRAAHPLTARRVTRMLSFRTRRRW